MEYLILRWVHIVSSTVLFGTGIGLAFFFFAAHRMREIEGIKFATRLVVVGDWAFTTPAGVIQIISGILLINELRLPVSEPWLLMALFLFAFAGVCWVPVVFLQVKMRDLAANAKKTEDLPGSYWKLERRWVTLGALAFPSLIAVFWLMVVRPVFWS